MNEEYETEGFMLSGSEPEEEELLDDPEELEAEDEDDVDPLNPEGDPEEE